MQLFTEWITQIILFILLGTIFELLLPDNQMKKYVNLILGLLLLLILSKPVMYVFSVDVETIMKPIHQIVQDDESLYRESENEMKKQKKEIQASQDAYIWNEVAAQLKQEANDQLPQKFGQEITDITLEHNNEQEITGVFCTLSNDLNAEKENEADSQSQIESIEIETGIPGKKERKQKEENAKLAQFLADTWELDSNIIHFK